MFATTAAAGLSHLFSSSDEVAITAAGYVAEGDLNLTLGFAPPPGTNLTVVRNAGSTFISGSFNGVPHGAMIQLAFEGRSHSFRANYFGGNGRSLVLEWANTKATTWGANDFGQLGQGWPLSHFSWYPGAVPTTTVLAGKSLIRIAAGSNHSLALASDGSLFAWGANGSGQLGNNSTVGSSIPVVVDQAGALAGQMIIAIAAGESHSLALSADGRVFAWGLNFNGRLGTGTTTNSLVPVAVNADGVLNGRTVVAIAAGAGHSLALVDDGTVVAWGTGNSGQLGQGSNTHSLVPVGVVHNGVLLGKSVASVVAGANFSLALTQDGRVFGWGFNGPGQLGVSGTTSSNVPVASGGNGGLIGGGTVKAIAAGLNHSLALTTGGRVFSWGLGTDGQLGQYRASGPVPAPVSTTGALAASTVTSISAGDLHSLAITSEGKAFAWGNNNLGQLGFFGFNSGLPTAVTTSSGDLGGRPVISISAGSAHTMALCGKGTAPVPGSPPESQTVPAGDTISFTATADGYPAPTVRWQQRVDGPGGYFVNISGNPTATSPTLEVPTVAASLNGHAYRAVFNNLEGSATTTPALLTVTPSYGWFSSFYQLPDDDPAADPFNTGVTNLNAYAFALDPTTPNRTLLPTASIVDGHLQIAFTRWMNSADVNYVVEVSEDLLIWQSGENFTEEIAAVPVDSARKRLTIRVLQTPTGARARFVRIRVSM